MESARGQLVKIVLGIIGIGAGLWFVYTVRGILAPFLLAFVLAYVLTPLVDRMEARGIKRTGSILIIFSCTFTLLGLGLVTAGENLTREMVSLTKEFMRSESSARQLVLANNGPRPLALTVTAETGNEENPFRLVAPEEVSFIIEGGREIALSLEFAPTQLVPAQGLIRIEVDGMAVALELPLQGNLEGKAPDAWNRPLDWGHLAFSTSGIDFGDAGPNIVGRISARVAELEPYIQPYLGEDTDLSSLIKEHGSNLIQVLLGRGTEVLGGLFSGIMLVVIVPFVAFFFLKEGRRITHGLVELVPNAYFEMTLNLMHKINNQIELMTAGGGFVR